MKKRIISIALALSVLICSFSAISANAATVTAANTAITAAVKTSTKKIALSKKKLTVTKDKTAKLTLKNAKASKVTWHSSKKKVAIVSSKGVVLGIKPGKATITAIYKGKKYKCKVTVKKAKLTKQQAFNKVKNYLVKNGEKEQYGEEIFYSILWKEESGITYEISYNKSKNTLVFQSLYNLENAAIMSNYIKINSKNSGYTTFTSFADDYEADALFKKSELNLKKGLEYSLYRGENQSETEVNKQANSYLQKTLPAFNKKLKEKTKTDLNQLGFTNWNK